MRRKRTMSATFTAVGLVAVAGATAVSQTSDQQREREHQQQPREQRQTRQTPAQAGLTPQFAIASEVLGAPLVGVQGEIGQVTDMIIDASTGHIVFAVVSAGGVIGIGAERYLVPAAEIEWNQNTQMYETKYDAARLQAMPEFDNATWMEMRLVGERRMQELREEAQDAMDTDEDMDAEDRINQREQEERARRQREQLENERLQEQRRREQSQQSPGQMQEPIGKVELVRLAELSDAAVYARTAMAADQPGNDMQRNANPELDDQQSRRQGQEQERLIDEHERLIDRTQQQQEERLRDRDMDFNPREVEKIGVVDNAVLDIANNELTFVIVTSDSIFGVGGDDRLAPWRAAAWQAERNRVILRNVTAASFQALPVYNDEAKQQLDQETFREQVYRRFGLDRMPQDEMNQDQMLEQERKRREQMDDRTPERPDERR